MIREYSDDIYYSAMVQEQKAYDSYRKRFNILELLNINLQNDTIYILESSTDLVSNYKASTIFTRKGFWSYYLKKEGKNYKKDSLVTIRKPLYPMHMLKLVIKWDIDSLEKEGEEFHMIPENYIRLIRVIFVKKKYKIEYASFKEFLKFDRDFYDDNHYKVTDSQIILEELFK